MTAPRAERPAWLRRREDYPTGRQWRRALGDQARELFTARSALRSGFNSAAHPWGADYFERLDEELTRMAKLCEQEQAAAADRAAEREGRADG